MDSKKITLLILDIDGTMTDGKIYMGADGELFKAFNVKDGYAIRHLLPDLGIHPVVITGRKSSIVLRRCEELGITEIYQDCVDKESKLRAIAIKYGLTMKKDGKLTGVAYMGDDLLDIPCMKISEISACPLDAVEQVKKCVDYVCHSKGGEGAVREFVEWICKGEYQRH